MQVSPLEPAPAPLGPWMKHWVAGRRWDPAEVDCATAVMLKILDGKCKMNPREKVVMVALYDAVKGRPGLRLGAEVHDFIHWVCGRLARGAGATAEDPLWEQPLRQQVYEYRVLAETMISRPVMKAFKAAIRRDGVFDLPPECEPAALAEALPC